MILRDFGVVAIILIAVLAGGAGVVGTNLLNEYTDTTKAERCAMRAERMAALEALTADRELTEDEQTALEVHAAYVHTVCSDVL